MAEVDYEVRRRAQILANRQVMEATGLLAAAKDVRPVTQAFPSTQTKRIVRCPRILEPSRRSARAASKPAPSYREADFMLLLSRREVVISKRRFGARRTDFVAPVDVDPGYTRAAREAAAEAADELCQSLQNPAGWKEMTHSMVAHRFWMQCPSHLVAAISPGENTKKVLTYETPDRCAGTDFDDFDHAVQGSRPARWEVVWNPKGPSSSGFSGGWVGFSKDNQLKIGDVVAWEVLSPDRIRAHIIRTAHYEKDPLLRATAPGGAVDGGNSSECDFDSADTGEDLEAGLSSDTGAPGSDGGVSSDGDGPAATAAPPSRQGRRRQRTGSLDDRASSPAAEAAHAQLPKRTRGDSAEAAEDGAAGGSCGTADVRAASSAEAPPASPALSPQAAWPSGSRQAQVTHFLVQRKHQQGEEPADGGTGEQPARRRPKHNSSTADPLVRIGAHKLQLKTGSASGAAAAGSESQQRRGSGRASSRGSKKRRSGGGGSTAKNKDPAGPPPVRVSQEGDGVYVVAGLVDKAVQGGRTLWRVRWHGYTEADDTWEPTECLDMAVTKFKWLGAPHAKPTAADC